LHSKKNQITMKKKNENFRKKNLLIKIFQILTQKLNKLLKHKNNII